MVDDKIYNNIENWLERYASEYVQWKLADTKALVLPVNLNNINAYDIYRMMENIYFDWLKDVNSQLIWLIMFWDIPLPVVNQDGYVFPTVYPYVDFENQKYVWDEESQYFVPNWNPEWQAEVWHWLINYWDDIDAYSKFFEKIKRYTKNPEEFIWDSMWYEDFIAQKQAFLDDNYQYYRNKIMFWEDIWYQRYSPLMKKLFSEESQNNSLDILSELSDAMEVPFSWLDTVADSLLSDSSENHTTKMIQQEIETSMLADYNELFWKSILSTIRENIFAGWRWVKTGHDSNWKTTRVVDADNSASKIQLKDTMYLWNENLQWLLENLNLMMEKMVDKKIADNKYDMDIVIPVSYEKISGRRISTWWHRTCYRFVERFDNYYFWTNARYIDKAQDLSIYRWTYRNISDLDWVTFDSLKDSNNPTVGDYDPTNLKLKSIWSSYDIFSNQVEWNRWYMLTDVDKDLNTYYDKRTLKDWTVWYRGRWGKVLDIVWPDSCGWDQICEDLFEFANRWWWWASPVNLDTESVSSGRYQLSGYKATDSWRSIFNLWWFQSLLPWANEWDNGRWWVDWKWVWPQDAATSFKAYIKYSSPTQRQWWERKRNHYERYNNNTPDVHRDVANEEVNFSKLNYRDLDWDIIKNWKFTPESSKIFSIAPKSVSYSCRWSWRRTMNRKYTYKVISSIVKHVSTTEDEINWIDKNKYWEWWTLRLYYTDLKNAYKNVEDNVAEIYNSMNSLEKTIKNRNVQITNSIEILNNLGTLESNKLEYESQLSSLQDENSTYIENRESADEMDKPYWSWLVEAKTEEIFKKQGDIEEVNTKIGTIIKPWQSVDEAIWDFLVNLSGSIYIEKRNLSQLYGLISSLSADEIPAIMEYIMTEEWLSPEDFYATERKENITKVWFSSSWISELKSSESLIKKRANAIIFTYATVYKELQAQKAKWEEISSTLKNISSANSNAIDGITESFNKIFIISWENSDSVDWESELWSPFSASEIWDADEDSWSKDKEVTLEENTAESLIKPSEHVKCPNTSAEGWEEDEVWLFGMFDGECGIDEMFNWLIEEDKVAPKIEQAAKNDNDFKKWLSKNSIDSSKFTQADWINQYAAWTQWPGYDSKWAKENHDLLLWVSEHIPGMNILTPDRPIDSPRYVSMQSVAWNEMKFIYPDLFKVEVFTNKWSNGDWYDVHQLLTVWEIKKNLIKYLVWKTSEYNKILQTECNHAKSMDSYFLWLQNLWYYWAIPSTSFHHCDSSFTYDDFVKALWWEKMLDAIAEMLYYQNLTNTRKLSSVSVAEDIDLIKDSFNLNDKREQVLQDYLVEWNEKIKNPLFIIPTYELSGYEVGYVNSNGRDYIIPDSEDTSKMAWLTPSSRYNSTTVWSSKNVAESTPEEMKLNDECGIPSSWRLPLFSLSPLSSPWFDWFICWMKTTLKKPVNVKLTFDNSLGDILESDSLWDYVKNSDLGQTFSDWWDSWDKFADDWESMITKDGDTNTDKLITQMQVDADKHNKEVISWESWLSSTLLNVERNVKVSNSNNLLSDSNPSSDLEINSLVDIGSVNVEFIWTWDWCLKIGDEELCKGKSIVKAFNPKTEPFRSTIVSSDHVAWKFALIVRIGTLWQYIEKVIKFTVSPWLLDSVSIEYWNKVAVAWMLVPVEVVGYDKYKNRVSWGTEKLKFTLSSWRFLKDWAYQESFETNDFRNLRFYYQPASDVEIWGESFIRVSKAKDLDSELAKQSIPVVKANPDIRLNWKQVEGIQYYKLKSDESIYDEGKLNISKLQKIDIVMKDLKWKVIDIDSQIIVNSQNGLVVLWQLKKWEDWNYEFFGTSKNYISNWYATVYYYPTNVAWEDIISIEIPWLDVYQINLSIQPGELANVMIVPEREVLNQWDSMWVELFLIDAWWNLIDGTNLFKLDFDDSKIEFFEYPSAKNSVNVLVEKWYKKLNVKWVGAWLTYLIWWWVYAEINIDKHIFPDSGLNIMYLNYFGNDWWNQWWYFSNNDNYIEKLMNKSNKVITTTTQLISEDKIKKLAWKIQPWFKILNQDRINTTLTMWNGKINMKIWWVASMEVSMPSSINWNTWTQDSILDVLADSSNISKNYIFFIPGDLKYSVGKNWEILEDGEEIWNILSSNVSLQLTDYSLQNWDNVRNVMIRGVKYWSLVIHFPKIQPSLSDFTLLWDRYLLWKTFSNWSTDSLWSVWIFDWASNFELETNYTSIQNSDDIDERVWFLWDFKNITLFAEWEIVWEATKKFGSEFVINLWDPVLSRKDKNDFVYGTKFDGWIGDLVYSDTEKDIYSTYQMDFNNDGNEDLLVVYLDWTIKLAKNYWRTPDLRNMQELMRIAVGIQDVFVWDLDGNKYDDILVYTTNNQLRAYLNNGWIFDVDWSVVCLNQNVIEWEKSDTPSDLEWIFQLFIEDMNVDGVLDVVTYDNMWYIKVFYWWTTDGWLNYLSKDKYSCDAWWYDRQSKNTTVVAELWVQISWEDVFDNSLLHWKWMSRTEVDIDESELSEYWIDFDVSSLEWMIDVKTDKWDWNISSVIEEVMGNIDLTKASEKYLEDTVKFVDVTLYENELEWWWDGNNYLFAASSFLDPNNPDDIGSVRKNYRVNWSWPKVLQNWDTVTVRVTIKASNKYGFEWAYWDIIQWPWNLYFDDAGIFQGIRFKTNQGSAVVKKKDGNFAYIIDNIKLAPWEKMIFEYDLQYHSLPLREMSIAYKTFWSNDDIPDIKFQSVDGCEKDFDVYINWWRNKRFSYKKIPLQDMINDEYLKEDDMTQDYGSDLMNVWSDISKLPGLVWDSISRRSLLWGWVLEVSDDDKGKKTLKNAIMKKIEDGGLESLNIDLDIDLSLFEEQTDAIEDAIDDITKWMCNGFSFWWSSNCKWLPVPFNQAFLAPGQYHLFGCWQIPMGPLEGWLPSFFFPWTLWVPTPAWPVPVPIPYWLKSGTDGFLWPWWWVYPSFIRIYAAPTLTAQLWIAVCASPDAVWRYVPSPVSDIMWNCVVFAVKPQCKWGGGASWTTDDEDNPDEVYTEIIEEVRDSGVCKQSQKWRMVTVEWKRSSPFNLHSDVNVWDGFDVDASFLWIINLEIDSYVWSNETSADKSSATFMIWDVDVLWWKYSINKIRWGIQQWVRKMLIDKWLDPQIRYILNQLTKMHINIILPDMSNLSKNEVQVMGNLINNFWDYVNWSESDDSNTNTEWWKVSAWERISRENVEEFNKQIANPFEALSSLMNESNIINISTETLTVKVPMIFPEDINAYEIYLHQWLDTNTQIVNERKSVLETMVANCDKEATEHEKNVCREKANENLRSFIEFQNGDWQTMQNQIYANIMILQKYRNFPFEIYEWIHVIDRYMSELMSLVNNTIWYLAYWTNTNSQRFVWYVDAIVLILNIIKTYQLLIDFSIEWGQNCGNCARDTYDQYSCKLSLLCDMIQLPIIQIPNFKLPNITIDLSNIDISLDIVLPKFNFQPISINLPQLPNLPEPPSISVNIKLFDLPNIPLLPEPPDLPELPSFIPEVELDLPILPPAPEVPKLPNSIEWVIKIAKLIWKIYCIVKWQFGLVWESSVKAKIEQLTQRTYDVPWIDTIMDFTNWSVAPVHNYWVDYEIDSYLDLQFNFTDFYDYLDTLTKSINNLTTSSVNQLNSKLDSMVYDSEIQWLIDDVDGISYEGNFDLTMGDINWDVEWVVSDDVEYVEYSKWKSRLREVLALFREETKTTSLGDKVWQSIDKIENQIDRENSITSNTDWLDKVRLEVIEYLDNEKTNYKWLMDMINENYEGFLAMVQSEENDIKDGENEKLLTFNVNLFNVDSSTKDTIKSVTKDNPYEMLIGNKQSIVDGYRNALNQNTAEDLWLTNSQYLVLRDDVSSMRNQINLLYTLTKPYSPTNLIAKNWVENTRKSLYAGLRLWSQMEAASVIDPSVVSKWIYEKIEDWENKWKLTKIIYSDSFAEAMWDSYYDTSHTQIHDKVLWNNSSIYKKCYNQDCFKYNVWSEKKYYHSKTINNIPYEEERVTFDSYTKLKIADKKEEVKNWKVVWQNYDILSFSWDNVDADWYLIKLVDRVDRSYEKSDYKPNNKLYVPKYVLALPDNVDIDKVYADNIQLELFDDKAYTIESLSWNAIVEIIYYNPNKSKINIWISEIDRKWYYSRIASLSLNKDTYNITSPRSNQVVAWRQIVWDDLPPLWDATLIRKFDQEIASEGDHLDWYIWTRYILRVNWDDNVALSHISISKDWKLLSEKSTSKAKDYVDFDITIQTNPWKEVFTSVWVDQFGNVTEKNIIVEYFVPEIAITDVVKNSDWESLSVIAELSQDIDQWSVSFQRKRWNSWSTMKPIDSENSDFQLVPKQKVISWSAFSLGNEIAMYDKKWDTIALLDPDTAEIKMKSEYADSFGIRSVVTDGVVFQIYDKTTQDSVFSLSVPAQECRVEAEKYTVKELPEKWNMWMYNGWKVVYKDWINQLFISPTCHLYSEYWMEWTYNYDRWLQAIEMTLYLSSDTNKKNPIKVWMKAKPLAYN